VSQEFGRAPITGESLLTESPRGKLLGLDVSPSHIGIAVCDPLQLAARPVSVIERASRRQDFEQIARLVRAEESNAVICGLPINMDGTEGEQALTIRKWAGRLAHALRALIRHPVPVIFQDERLSTYAAREFAADETDKVGEDAVAAAIILQRYLDRPTDTGCSVLDAIVLPEKRPEHN
jgi:putative holliday junction resolvase